MQSQVFPALRKPILPPATASTRLLGRIRTLLSALLLDHAIFRYFYNTRHRVMPGLYRSSHPLPSQLRAALRVGIRTVINLRGPDTTLAANRLEWEACKRYGLTIVHFPLRSRDAPTREEILGLNEYFKRVDSPILLHCKSGADRAGLASALYLLMQAGQPLELALGQLSFWRFGHIRQAKTGVLDHFFECYRRHRDLHGTGFEDWVRHHYDSNAVMSSFRDHWWATRLVDRVLRRE